MMHAQGKHFIPSIGSLQAWYKHLQPYSLQHQQWQNRQEKTKPKQRGLQRWIRRNLRTKEKAQNQTLKGGEKKESHTKRTQKLLTWFGKFVTIGRFLEKISSIVILAAKDRPSTQLLVRLLLKLSSPCLRIRHQSLPSAQTGTEI